MPAELVVLTGASGKQCSHLIPHLQDHFNLRLVVHSGTSLQRLQKRYPAAEVVQADLISPEACRRVVSGASTVYHLGPPLHPFERQIGFNVIDAAVAEGEGLQHFVLSSVLWSQLSKLRHHAHKREVEEYLIESPLCWTMLAPTHFIDNIPVKLLADQEKPVFPMMWDPETRMSFIALSDLGEIAATVIHERARHFYAHYALSSTPPVTYTAVLAELGRQLGKEVNVDRLSFEDSVQSFMKLTQGGEGAEGVHPETKITAELMLWHYRHYGLVGNTGVAEWLLGRKTIGYAAWFKRQIAAT